MRILIVNGPNLNLIGNREPQIYGTISLDECLEDLRKEFEDHKIIDFHSNVEGEIINRLQHSDYDGLIINPGAYTHYSYAIADCLQNINVPKIEVHISNLYKREAFRQKSVTAAACDAVLTGFGVSGYRLAFLQLLSTFKS